MARVQYPDDQRGEQGDGRVCRRGLARLPNVGDRVFGAFCGVGRAVGSGGPARHASSRATVARHSSSPIQSQLADGRRSRQGGGARPPVLGEDDRPGTGFRDGGSTHSLRALATLRREPGLVFTGAFPGRIIFVAAPSIGKAVFEMGNVMANTTSPVKLVSKTPARRPSRLPRRRSVKAGDTGSHRQSGPYRGLRCSEAVDAGQEARLAALRDIISGSRRRRAAL